MRERMRWIAFQSTLIVAFGWLKIFQMIFQQYSKIQMCLLKLEIVFAVDVLQGFLRFTLLRTKLPVSPRLSLLAAENAETTLFPIEFSS